MKTTVVYHSADFDGIFCREIAKKFLPDAELIGWDFGQPLVQLPDEGMVYVLDLNPDCFEKPKTDGFKFESIRDRIIWIDHHKSAIDAMPANIPGYRIDGVSACRLAWQWFSAERRLKEQGSRGPWMDKYPLPQKQDFISRTVIEPKAVQLAGEYDVWDRRDPDAETFQYGLRTRDLLDEHWRWLLTLADGNVLGEYDLAMCNGLVAEFLRDGKVAQRYAQKQDAAICENLTWLMKWEGLTFLCVNHARFNSLLFASRDVPETGHDALLGFRFDGKKWMVSLYHASHRKDLDLSEIAKRYGGGGHRGACGFTANTLPFIE